MSNSLLKFEIESICFNERKTVSSILETSSAYIKAYGEGTSSET